MFLSILFDMVQCFNGHIILTRIFLSYLTSKVRYKVVSSSFSLNFGQNRFLKQQILYILGILSDMSLRPLSYFMPLKNRTSSNIPIIFSIKIMRQNSDLPENKGSFIITRTLLAFGKKQPVSTGLGITPITYFLIHH